MACVAVGMADWRVYHLISWPKYTIDVVRVGMRS